MCLVEQAASVRRMSKEDRKGAPSSHAYSWMHRRRPSRSNESTSEIIYGRDSPSPNTHCLRAPDGHYLLDEPQRVEYQPTLQRTYDRETSNDKKVRTVGQSNPIRILVVFYNHTHVSCTSFKYSLSRLYRTTKKS